VLRVNRNLPRFSAAVVAVLLWGSCTAPILGQEADPDEEQQLKEAAASEGQKIQLTFPDEVELDTVIDYVAKRLNENILYGRQVASERVTIRAPRPVASDELIPLLRSVLRFRGFVLVKAKERDAWRIEQDDDLIEQGRWLEPGRAADDADQVVTTLVSLDHMNQEPFRQLIEPFMTSGGGNVAELPGGKALVITHYARVIETVKRLKKHADRAGLEQTWEIYELEHAGPEQIDGTLQSLLDATPAVTQGAGDDQQFRAVPIASLQSYLLSGTSKQIKQAKTMIETLDEARPVDVRFYQLEHTSAERAAKLLEELIRPMRQRGVVDQFKVTPDAEGGAILVTAPPKLHEQVSRWLEQNVDTQRQSGPSGTATRVYPVKFAEADELVQTIREVFSKQGAHPAQLADSDADAAVETEPDSADSPGGESMKETEGVQQLDPFKRDEETDSASDDGPEEGQAAPPTRPEPDTEEKDEVPIGLTVDTPTNSIIASGPRGYLAQVSQLIDRLDHHQPQVLIEATIVSLNASDTLDLGVEVQYLDPDNGELATGVLSSFGLSQTDAETGETTASIGSGLNAVLLRSGEVNVMMRALQTRMDAKVVAKPRLLVSDNETGTLNSFDEEPFTSLNAGETVSTTSFGGYVEAGTELELTPHISESDVVHLDYRVRTSSFTGSSTEPNIPPPRSTDSVNSQVTIPSGYTLLVGGLTRQDHRDSREQVPVLGDIPIAGALFRSTNDSNSQTILYAFLKPVIHREDQFSYLRYQSQQAFEQADVDGDVPPLEMETLR